MNKKTLTLVVFVVVVLGLGRYYSNTNENLDQSTTTQVVSSEIMKEHQPFSMDLSSLSYSEVVDPEVIMVNDTGVSIDNRLEIGDILSDIAVDKPTGTFDTIEKMQLSMLEGYTLMYSLPSLDTPVCSKQAKEIEFAGKYFETINFVTISHDMPFALERFCGDNNINNVLTLSDARTKQFAQENGLYMSEFDLMTRAVVIIDENLQVLYVDYADEVTQDVDLINAFAFLKNL